MKAKSKSQLKNFRIFKDANIQQRKVVIQFFLEQRSFCVTICKRNAFNKERAFNKPFFLTEKVIGELPSSMTRITTAFPSQETSLFVSLLLCG